MTPRKYAFYVISIGQRSSPWPCNAVKVEMKFHLECKLHFPCAQLMLWQMHWTNLSASIEYKYWVSWLRLTNVNPFTPESDQCQNSPAASQEIWHRTVWRTWLFIAYSDEKWLHYKFSLHHSYNRFLKGWENTLFELRSERVKTGYENSPWVWHFVPVSQRIWIPRSISASGFGPPGPYPLADLDPSRRFGPPS